MKKKIIRRSCLTAGVAAVSMLGGCGGSQDEWANSPGTNGHTNLDAVRAAFQKAPKLEDFENRVNQICEGDKLVMFRSDKVDGGFRLSAVEDLDGDKKISGSDDVLFTLLVANGTATLKGEGVTSYYTSTWAYDPVAHTRGAGNAVHRTGHHCTHFHHWYGRSYLWGGGYYTRAPRYSQMMSQRSSYRGTSAFASQVKSNASSEKKMSSKYGSGFRSAAAKTSSNRKSYVKKSVSSGNYKAGKGSSGWGVRSKSGTKSSFSSSRGSSSKGFGGFRGTSGFEV
jgi:hypothetical protein